MPNLSYNKRGLTFQKGGRGGPSFAESMFKRNVRARDQPGSMKVEE